MVLPDLVLLLIDRSDFCQAVYGPDFPRNLPARLPPTEAAAALGGPAAFVAHDSLEAAAVLRRLWGGAVALPIQIGCLLLAARALYPRWRPALVVRPSGVALGVGAWAVVTPVVLAFNFGVNYVFTLFDGVPQSHGLTKFGSREWFDPALFLFQACVAAPLVEELLFRGVILAWALGGRKPEPAPDAPPETRVWFVAVAAVLFAALAGGKGPIAFALVLVVGLAVVRWVFPRKRRTAGAVWASAAVFAAVHSPVWPSPIPLFVLGLALGWLAVRTRGVLVPCVVHGFFNAVSAVYVLRGGAG
jgi:membrane protease YdiL (CAAX protease family)